MALTLLRSLLKSILIVLVTLSLNSWSRFYKNFFLCHLCTGQISWTVVPNMPGPVFLSQVRVFKKCYTEYTLGALPINIRLHWKAIYARASTLAYLFVGSMAKKKSLMKMTPGTSVVNLFSLWLTKRTKRLECFLLGRLSTLAIRMLIRPGPANIKRGLKGLL